MSKHPCRVLCVDDNPYILQSLTVLFEHEADLDCVGCLPSADRLVEEVVSRAPDVVLLDASMRGRNAFLAMTELAVALPQVKTIIYSAYDDDEFIRRASDAGAWACVSKNDPVDVLLRAVRQALLAAAENR